MKLRGTQQFTTRNRQFLAGRFMHSNHLAEKHWTMGISEEINCRWHYLRIYV
uniref:Uncharacterized protein n=1 Tax=Arundo donax TaxID=35708 RepID=A0A0A9GH37_ARUDO